MDEVSTFVIAFFVSYVVLALVRPAVVLCVRDERIMLNQVKLMLLSILFALVTVLVHMVQDEPRTMSFGRRTRFYY